MANKQADEIKRLRKQVRELQRKVALLKVLDAMNQAALVPRKPKR